MLSFIQKLLGKSQSQTKAPLSSTSQHAEPSGPILSVEVVQLKLTAILDKLPEELKPLVLKAPEPTVTVALPMTTIVKQLSTGAVKMSLATLHRQAPAGIFGPLPPGDKRMVDVPLAEVFRHVSPAVLKRRPDQRHLPELENKFNLFGDPENPHQITTAPSEDELAEAPVSTALDIAMPAAVAAPVDAPKPTGEEPAFGLKLARDPAPAPPRILAPPPELFESKPATVAPLKTPVPVSLVAPTVQTAPPVPVKPVAPAGPSISVAVEPLSGAWPEPIRSELAILNGSARVALPTADVTAGLARGRVTFSWGQIRSWLEPGLGEPTQADDATELTLPLKVVAPVFLAASKAPQARQKSTSFDSEIPALFSPAHAPAPAPVAEVAPVVETLAPPVVEVAPPAPKKPETVGEVFGQPDKAEWTPAEIVANLANLPGVSGAVVALQEGLLVAHSLPADVKSEVIAAFLPQIFARLNQYAGEMKLGEVDDLLFTTHGAHCQIYRLGYVYFAVLGKPGEELPWPQLRLVAAELARQTKNS